MSYVIRTKKISLVGERLRMQNNQSGRSMIEMLGVLAIIGVLSVGSMAGFSKLMTQYRINTTMQQIQMISSKLSAMGTAGGSYKGLSANTAYRLNALPAEMVDVSSGSVVLSNAYGGAVLIEPASITSGECGSDCDNQAYTITYRGLPKEACITLGAGSWNTSRNSSFIGVGVGVDTQPDAENNVQGNIATVKGLLLQGCGGAISDGNYVYACAGSGSANSNALTLPLSLGNTSKACACTNDDCMMVVKFF